MKSFYQPLMSKIAHTTPAHSPYPSSNFTLPPPKYLEVEKVEVENDLLEGMGSFSLETEACLCIAIENYGPIRGPCGFIIDTQQLGNFISICLPCDLSCKQEKKSMKYSSFVRASCYLVTRWLVQSCEHRIAFVGEKLQLSRIFLEKELVIPW